MGGRGTQLSMDELRMTSSIIVVACPAAIPRQPFKLWYETLNPSMDTPERLQCVAHLRPMTAMHALMEEDGYVY